MRPADLHLDDTAPASETGAAEQMKELHAALGSNSHQKTYIYCMIGRNLSMLQSGRKGKEFVEFVQQYLPANHCNNSQIYFLINLHKLM